VLYGTLPFEADVPTVAGRLDGAPVFLAHGSQDTVIPPELQARTWDYLHQESGAKLTARRDPGSHGLAPAALVALREWLADLI
jgi:phospholipase/carboxylesterase